MNKQKLQEYAQTLRSPAFLIGASIVIGLFLNVYVLSFFVLPVLTGHETADTRVQSLAKLKENELRNPTPMKATDAEIEAQLRQVPIKEEMPRFYLNLKEIEKQSGVTLNNIQYGEGNQGSDGLAMLMNGAGAKNAAGANQAPQAHIAPNAATGAVAPNTGSAIQEIHMTAVVSGTYAQITSFIQLLDQSERLIAIREWSLQVSKSSDQATAGTVSTPSSNEFVANEAYSVVIDKISLNLKLSLFAANGYVGKFKEAAPIPTKEVERRVDPTWSEQQFMRLLETNN
ncbi:hypothetical protein [Paenibacillus agricola]|uniref:Uncharacterized protein n=1 Tax=Paenibacillus agricola TaxID=2716264 RepID=A0ABX0J368_9BACL|nr:hypothetical protein [Paenibacillus agricola]NHN30734.1 hypothetical protein [Paenibacillus agricola]